MSDEAVLKSSKLSPKFTTDQDSIKTIGDDVRATKTADLRKRVASDTKSESALGPLKIKAAPQETEKPANDYEALMQEEESVLMLEPSNTSLPEIKLSGAHKAVYGLSAAATLAWLAFCLIYAFQNGGFNFAPHQLGAFLAGMFAPPALLWLITTSMHRQAEAQLYAASLRSELQSLIFPSEETSSLINKDVERLCRQAAEVSAASKAVLKSLQRARQGLRVEIRDFSGVSKKAEFHIDRLAESLNERAAKLASLTDEIEERTSNIDERTQAGADAWDQATLNVLERAAEIEAAMDKGADKLLSAADKAGDKTQEIEANLNKTYDSLNEAVDDVAARLDTVSTKFDDHTSDLSGAADQVSDEVQRLSEMIRDQIEGLEDVTDKTVEVMARSSETIQDHRSELDRGAEGLAKQSEKIAGAILDSVEKLDGTARQVESRAEKLEANISEKTQQLSEVVQGISTEAGAIEEAGSHAANQLNEALVTAVSGAETIGSAVRRAVETLEESTKNAKEQADTLMESAANHVAQLNDAGEGNVEHIKSIVEMLEASRRQIEEVSQAAQDHVDALSKAVEQQSEHITVSGAALVERVESVQGALANPLKDIRAAISDADSRHEAIENVLRRRVSDLNDASEKATQSAETIRETLRGQAQEISTLSGQVAGNARTINEQMSVQKDELQDQVQEALSKIKDVSAQLESSSQSLSGVSDKAKTEITDLRDTISGKAQEISSFTGKSFKMLSEMDEALESKITILDEKAENAAESIESVRTNLIKAADDIEPIYLRSIEKAKEAQDRFDTLKAGYETSTESNLSKLQRIGVVFDERLVALKDGAGEAADILRSSSDHLEQRVSEIESASHEASEKMRKISLSLSDQSSDIHLIADKAVLKVEGVQNALNEQFHELTASVGQAIAQMQDAGIQFVKHSEQVQDEAQKAVTGFETAGDKARDEVGLLNEAVHKASVDTEQLVVTVQGETQNMLKTSGEALFTLKQTSDSFGIRAREVAEQMKASLDMSERYGRELRKQAASVAEASGEAVDELGKSVSVLKSNMDDIGKAAKDVNVKIEQSRESLAGESERLISVSTAALETTQESAENFGRQSKSLIKASQDAARFAENIRKASGRAQGDAFMSASKFIIESLHSLSVDVTRTLDGEISEKTWKSFQKGDVAAFTRRLSELSTDIPMDKARDKFAKDTEFRTYVQRFLRQFEEMYEQAYSNDHGAMLSTTISSSEVGKLYGLLCDIAGKKPVIEEKTAKAA